MANKKDAFSDLTLDGMNKYNDRNAEAQRLKRAAEMDDRIRTFAAKEKNAKWIEDAEEFCRGEELANKDVFDLSKEAYRLPMIIEEARGLAKLAEEERLAKIEKESREKQAKLEAEAKEKALRDKLSREERDRANRGAAEAFDDRINALSKSVRTKHWHDEVKKANADAANLATDIKLLVKKLGTLDEMVRESKKILADEAAAEEERLNAVAREKAEREAALDKIENDKRVAKAKADAEMARIRAEREKREKQEKLEKEIAEAKANAAREAEAARIANEKRIAQEKADAEVARVRAEREKSEAKAKADREAEAARIANEKRIAQEKADAEAARIRAEREKSEAKARAEAEARAREDARIRREAEERDRLARIAAEAKEKELRERLGREEADRRDKESAKDMDDLIAKLSGAPRTKLWIAEVRKAYAAAEAMTTDAKLMVAGLDDLEAMYAEANARAKAKELDAKINTLQHTSENVEWARAVIALRNKLEGKAGVRDEVCVSAKPFMEKLQILYDMYEKTGPIIADHEKTVSINKAKKAAKERKEAAKRRRKETAEKIGAGVLSGLKLIGSIAFIAAIIVAGVVLSLTLTDYIKWTIPATVALALLAISFISKGFAKLTLPLNIIALIVGVVFIFVPADRSLAPISVVMGAYVLLQWCISSIANRQVKTGRRNRRSSGSENTKNIRLVGITLGGVLASVSVGLYIGGELFWLPLGIALAATTFVFVIMAHLDDVDSVVAMGATVAVPAQAAIFALSGVRALVFAGLMLIAGYFLGHLVRLLAGLARGESFTDVFNMGNYFEGIGPVVASTCVVIFTVLMFFCYIGYTDFIIDENGVLQKCYSKQETVVIPEGVTEIAPDAFNMFIHNTSANNGFTRKLVIPEGVTKIGANAFFWTFGVQELYLPSTLEKIEGETLFRGTLFKEMTVYYGGSASSAEAMGLDDKIAKIGDINILDEMFFNGGITQNLQNINFVVDSEYMEEFYKD